ncbi:MAG: DUF2851 family protein [Ignavibacteria bacterium]|nr:DUF2851 family protein [Ignavibacteria bacterium]
MNELQLQKRLQRLLSEPSRIWVTESGKQLQVLSPGRINPYEGPDFNNFGALLDSKIVTGEVEFHKNSSDWLSHNHSINQLYQNVFLHIVCNNDTILNENFETLVIPETEIENIIIEESVDREEILNQILDLQHYALVRILRKSAEIMPLLNNNDIKEALRISTYNFLDNYRKRRRRPVYNNTVFNDILDNLENSLVIPFLSKIKNNEVFDIFSSLVDLMRFKISNEGAALRRELVLNVVLPLAICLAADTARISLLTWFWSTPTLNIYGNLSRFFPHIEQKYLWQQQGMLEYLRCKGNAEEFPPNPLSQYKFDEVLDFYSVGLARKK